MPAAGAAIRNAEHTLDAADRTTDAGANRATDHTTDRTGSTIAFVRTLISAALHTSDDALPVCQMRNRKEGQRRRRCRCRCRELQPDGSFDRQCFGSDLHLHPLGGSTAMGHVI